MLVISFFPTASLSANSTINVTIDGVEVNFPGGQGPVIADGQTLVPVRGVFEMLGFNVRWDGDARTAVLTSAEYEVNISVDNYVFTTNNISHTLDVPAQIIAGRTMVPIRLPLESVGFNVEWDNDARTVVITSNITLPTAFTGNRTADFDGGTYTGQWVNDIPHGHGRIVWPNGSIYEGDWLNGNRTGQGVFIWPDGTEAVGEFVDGEIHGQGTITWPDGQSRTGIINRGVFQEIVREPSQIQYVGTWSSITIVGDATFTRNTQNALNLIRRNAPTFYTTVLRYIGVIQQGTSSGMWAWLEPPTFVVGRATYSASVTWYASAIVHDAIHSKQYHQHLAIYGYVPDNVWTGLDAEMEALEIQRSFLMQVDAPIHEIQHLDYLRDNSVEWWNVVTPWW